MPISPSLVATTLCVSVAASLVAGIFASPLGLASGQFLRDRPQASVGTVVSNFAAPTHVNRSHKGDRLPDTRIDPPANTTIALKNAGATNRYVRDAKGTLTEWRALQLVDDGKRVPNLAPAPMKNCEPLASPIADPVLSRLTGRCFT